MYIMNRQIQPLKVITFQLTKMGEEKGMKETEFNDLIRCRVLWRERGLELLRGGGEGKVGEDV